MLNCIMLKAVEGDSLLLQNAFFFCFVSEILLLKQLKSYIRFLKFS